MKKLFSALFLFAALVISSSNVFANYIERIPLGNGTTLVREWTEDHWVAHEYIEID